MVKNKFHPKDFVLKFSLKIIPILISISNDFVLHFTIIMECRNNNNNSRVVNR